MITSSMINKRNVKLINSAGIIKIIGMTSVARYRLLGQNMPWARFGKSFIVPSLAIFLDTTFKPDIHSELSNL